MLDFVDMEKKHKEELETKSKINLDLKSEIQLLKEKIKEMIEDERKRFQPLQKAFEAYLKPMPGTQRNEDTLQSGDMSMVHNIEE